MQLTINNKNYTLYFGLGFLDEINKRQSLVIDNLPTGYGGMSNLYVGLLTDDPSVVVTIIKAATAQALQKPSNEELELFLEHKEEVGEFDKLANDLFEEIKKSPLLRKAMNSKKWEVIREMVEKEKAKQQKLQTPQVNPTPQETNIPIPTETVSQF